MNLDINTIKQNIINDGKRNGFSNLNLNNPKTIQEKIAWLKIFDITELKGRCADKILLREYCKEKLGKDICIPIIKEYNSPNEINLNDLPNRFVLKCNHGWNMNIICRDKSTFNLNTAISKCNKWLNTDFGKETYQYHYSLIKPKCFVEQYMENTNGLTDYKFWCQNGIPQFIQVVNDRFIQNNIYSNTYDLDWKPFHLGLNLRPENWNKLDKRPETLNQMIEYAKILSEDFKLVRVDFYEVNGKLYLSELTFTPDNGWFKFSEENNIKYGNLLYLDQHPDNHVNNKVALCAIGKNENLYIREWVEYYKNIGISKIFLYDNNDIDGEKFEDVIDNYVKSGFVEIINVRGKEKGLVYDKEGINLQTKCYIDCYENKLKDFDWVCFFDIDEFLEIKENNDINSFLNNSFANNADTILIPWVHYDSNNFVEYDNKPVLERFNNISTYQSYQVKSLVKTGKPIYNKNLYLLIHNFVVNPDKIYKSDGSRINVKVPTNKSTHSLFVVNRVVVNNSKLVLKHFKAKSFEEMLKRYLNRHWGTNNIHHKIKLLTIIDILNDFFLYNSINTKSQVISNLEVNVYKFLKEKAPKLYNNHNFINDLLNNSFYRSRLQKSKVCNI